jgi:microcin C transport system permease protein
MLLIIPTMIGIMIINFALTQFVPGGPVEQVLARLEGDGDATEAISGSGDAGIDASGSAGDYIGARGLPPEFIAQLEEQFGFARIICTEGFTGKRTIASPECRKEMIPAVERFFIMMGKYLTFDFGESYFRSIGVFELVAEKIPVSLSLGLWSTLLAYAISIPLGIRKAVRDGSSFDTWTSAVIIVGYAIPGFLFAIMLIVLFAGGSFYQWFPLRGLTSEGWESMSLWGKATDYLWHITLPVVATTISSFATLTLLTKNSFLEEIKKLYVTTARAKGLSEKSVLYGHVFRNAMLIVIAGFPAAFISVFFGASLIIETIFSLDGLGQLGFKAAVERDYPVVFGTLFVFGIMGLAMGIVSDLMYVWIDPRIDFERRG